MPELLSFDRVIAGYGDSVVLEDVSFSMQEGDSLALLGRNGVGKSTLLVTLMGLTQLHRGAIRWCGADIAHVPTHMRAQGGLGWVPQERFMFPSLTVEEHLTVVARPGEWDLRKIYSVFPRLQERRANMGNQLSGGEQQMLAIARRVSDNASRACCSTTITDNPLSCTRSRITRISSCTMMGASPSIGSSSSSRRGLVMRARAIASIC